MTLYMMHLLLITPFKRLSCNSVQPLADIAQLQLLCLAVDMIIVQTGCCINCMVLYVGIIIITYKDMARVAVPWLLFTAPIIFSQESIVKPCGI